VHHILLQSQILFDKASKLLTEQNKIRLDSLRERETLYLLEVDDSFSGNALSRLQVGHPLTHILQSFLINAHLPIKVVLVGSRECHSLVRLVVMHVLVLVGDISRLLQFTL